MRAYKYLAQISCLDALVENKLAEKQRVLELGEKTQGHSKARLASLEQEIDKAVDRLVDRRRAASELLETLPVEEYTVLHQYYIRGRTMEVIAANWQPRPMTVRQVYRIKNKALGHVQTLLDAPR